MPGTDPMRDTSQSSPALSRQSLDIRSRSHSGDHNVRWQRHCPLTLCAKPVQPPQFFAPEMVKPIPKKGHDPLLPKKRLRAPDEPLGA